MGFLRTGLKEIETKTELEQLISENENVMVCCGRMGSMCLPVFSVMEQLEDEYSNIKFRVMAFDNPESAIIRNTPECLGFSGLPFTMYYKNGNVVKGTSSIQNIQQVTDILDTHFGK
jgi:thioredoxin 1